MVLIDRDQEAADKGKAYSQKLLDAQIKRGRAKQADADALLARITRDAGLRRAQGRRSRDRGRVRGPQGEGRGDREGAGRRRRQGRVRLQHLDAADHVARRAGSKDPTNFIGVHFFSPVDKMMLVEIIMGEKTGDPALAVALDYVRAIRKTPIVVNDSRGFYTSRVVGTYIREGHLMLTEGVPAAMIENVGRMAGMPVGPLSLNDEVAVDLAWKILKATEADLGAKAIDARQKALLEEMVEKRGRYGRKNGKGFYDYPATGPKRLWPGLAELQKMKLDPDTIDVEELKHRLLAIQALETARCFEEGVLTDVREADVGSILGFGYAPYSGGTLSYIDMMGTKKFVALCEKLAQKYGERFKPNKLLVEMAAKGESFYSRFAPKRQKAAA